MSNDHESAENLYFFKYANEKRPSSEFLIISARKNLKVNSILEDQLKCYL